MKRALLILLLATTAIAQSRYQNSDRFRIVNLSDPQVAPDGKSVVVIASRANTKDNRYDGELLLVDTASSAQRALTAERRGLASPRWSPDGESLAFLANSGSGAEARRQIFVMPLRGGDAVRITDAARGVQQFAWSPDGAQIGFVTSDEPAANEEKNNKSFEIGDDDYMTTAAPAPSHLWIVGVADKKARRVTSGTWSVPVAHPPGPAPSPLSWSADGKTIAITRRETAHGGTPNISRVALVDVATGNVRRLTARDQDEGQPVFSPDGTRIAYWHPRNGERGNENAIWIAPASGGAGTEVTSSLDLDLYRAIWMPDGQSFLTGAHAQTSVGYWRVPAAGGKPARLDLGDVEPAHGYWPDASVSKSGAIAFTGVTPSHPRELFFLASADAKPRQLTQLNDWISERQLGRAEQTTWTFEGFSENGVVILPPGYDAAKKYPLVVYIHGGPRSSSTTGFSSLTQFLAAHDWIVFSPNYRGSDNLGNAYIKAIELDAGAGPGRDVMAGIDAVKKKYSVDEKRIAVGGWSYGGYMTSWMIGHYPIFKAAVSGAAVNNMLDTYNLADNGPARRRVWGSPYTSEANMRRWLEFSPITFASKIKTPTLIMSDTGDVRVPITQSYQMFHALRDNGVETKFIAYPVTGHSPDDPVHAADVERRYAEWFESHLK
jgi:dipeptidyl aminopeptidase/acylaminoacyl peptidase